MSPQLSSAAEPRAAGARPAATPFLRIHRTTLLQNLDRLAAYVARHGLKLRPHAKTHKSVQIARWQLERGAVGLTVAKPGEAEVLAEACQDLLLAYPVVDQLRAQRMAKLAHRVDLKVAVDSEIAVQVLSEAAAAAGSTIGVLIDLDVGLHRTGVQGVRAAVQLAQCVQRMPGLALRGLFCYPGHIWQASDAQGPALLAVAAQLEEAADNWRKHGLSLEIVSAGSTPTAYQSHLVKHFTEIRPGTYVFNDMNTVYGGYATIQDCAARVVVTVVSDAVPDQVVIDAGSKTLAADRCIPAIDSGHGHVVEYPDARITKLSEEHGQVDVTRCSEPPRVGDRLTVIPNHICPCINLQDEVWLDTDESELRSLAIDARGKLT